MTPLRQHMIAALQLSGKSERTQQSYGREVRLLAQCYHTSPDRLAAQALQRSCLHRTNVDGRAPTSMRLCSSGLRFCSQHVRQRDWHTLALLRAHTTHRLPAVLSIEAVKRLLQAATPLHNQLALPTVSSVRLRRHEALSLQVSAIEGQRLTMGVAIHPLRHAYATPLLEAGVPPRLIQRSLGHTPLETPMLSLHLTHPGQAAASERLNTRLPDLLSCPPCGTSSPPVRPHPWRARL